MRLTLDSLVLLAAALAATTIPAQAKLPVLRVMTGDNSFLFSGLDLNDQDRTLAGDAVATLLADAAAVPGTQVTWANAQSGNSGAVDELMQPHAMAFDSRGRLFVADRSNNRVLIMDQDFNHIATWAQFSRASGLFIDKNDVLYSADSESGSVNPAHKAWVRGIRIGSAKDGKVIYFIPDPQKDLTSGTLAAEGVAADSSGNVYGAEVGPKKVQKYVMKK